MQNTVRIRLAGGSSPSPGGVVQWMELRFGFRPTPPGRYLGFGGLSTRHVQHFGFIIVSFLVCYFHFCNFIYIKFVMLIYLLNFLLCRCTVQYGLSEAGAPV
jgi:hypothetical protein